MNAQTPFTGFDLPKANFFSLPKNWTDITCDITSIAELKCVEYVIRHTWGYQEYGIKKKITNDEFIHGRKRKDGSRLDRGTGLDPKSVRSGLKKAVEDGFVIEAIDDSDKARVKKYYSIRLKSQKGRINDPISTQHQTPRENFPAGGEVFPPRGGKLPHRSEKETLPTEVSHIDSDNKKTNKTSELKQLPTLKLDADQARLYADEMAETLADANGHNFFLTVAWRVPEGVWRPYIKQILEDAGAKRPAAVFNSMIKEYAKNKLGNPVSDHKQQDLTDKKADLLAGFAMSGNRKREPT